MPTVSLNIILPPTRCKHSTSMRSDFDLPLQPHPTGGIETQTSARGTLLSLTWGGWMDRSCRCIASLINPVLSLLLTKRVKKSSSCCIFTRFQILRFISAAKVLYQTGWTQYATICLNLILTPSTFFASLMFLSSSFRNLYHHILHIQRKAACLRSNDVRYCTWSLHSLTERVGGGLSSTHSVRPVCAKRCHSTCRHHCVFDSFCFLTACVLL